MGDGFDRGETFDVNCTGRNAVQQIETFASLHFGEHDGRRCLTRSATRRGARFLRHLQTVAGAHPITELVHS
jgi:hypothetical protein